MDGDWEISVEAVSDAFDSDYYRRRYGDIRHDTPTDEFAHYCQIGWREGRDPNDWFSTRLYLLAHLDVAIDRINPLIHYVLRGKRNNYTIFPPLPPSPQEPLLPPEVELIRPSFDETFYKAHNHDLGDIEPFVHFCTRGWRECRDPTPWFSMTSYLGRNPDVAEAGANPFIHYVFSRWSVSHGIVRKLRRPTLRPMSIGGIQVQLDRPSVVDGRAVVSVDNELLISGWAIAFDGIDAIAIFLNGIFVDNAHYGVRRPDIAAMYPRVPHAARCGFAVSLRNLRDVGWHQVKLLVRDKANNVRDIQFSFEVKAPTEAAFRLIRRKVPQAEFDLKRQIWSAQDPAISFALILYLANASQTELERATLTLRSVRRQVFPMWRLFVACPSAVHEAIAKAFGNEPGVPVIAMAEIVDTVRACDALTCFLRSGDILGCDALQEMALSAAINPHGDIFYSDERRPRGARLSEGVILKPEWSPDLLFSTNYVGRWWCFQPHLVDELHSAFEHGLNEYDLILRLTDKVRSVCRVPRVLCETAQRQDAISEKRALRQALRRRGIVGVVEDGPTPHYFRVKRTLLHPGAKVSIIIPTAGTANLIRTLVASIREHTAHRNFEIVCIDDTRDPGMRAWLRDNTDLVIRSPWRFNWSRGNNRAAAKASGAYFVFLNDDMEVTDPHWLDALLEHAQRSEVGVVGPQLLYPDGKVQHAGLVLYRGSGLHVFRGLDSDADAMIMTQREVIGVTGACMMVSRETFERLGGFDESHAVINNDLDFCLRCRRSGLRVIYTPHTKLIHHEESSRGMLPDSYDVARFTETWRDQIAMGDPYSHPHRVHDSASWRTTAEPVETLYVGHPLIGTPKRILVVKLDHIGDFVTAMPSIDRLKHLFPLAELTVLVSTLCAPLAQSMASVDRVLKFDFFHPQSSDGPLRLAKSKLVELKNRLSPFCFDIAIDLRQQFETRDILRYTAATWLAGYDIQNRFPWLDVVVETTLNHRTVAKRQHVADALLHLVDAVALACKSNRSVIPAKSQGSAPGARSALGKPLIVMQPGGGAAIKRWPAEHFAALADLLIERHGANIVVIGTEGEARIATKVSLAARGPLSSLVGRTALPDLLDVLASADLMIGNNSGPHHLAAGLSVPTVGIHAGVIDAREWGPLGPMAVTVGRSMHCSPCYLERISDCHRQHACMRDLLPIDVYRVCQQMLALRRPPTTLERPSN